MAATPKVPADRPEQDPPPEPEKAPETDEKADRDPWAEPCPVCGLLGCRRHT